MGYCHYNTKRISFLLFLHLLSFPGFAFIGKYPIQNFTTTDYKAGIQNIDFAQNRDMTIFIANNLGVLSFNGHDWKTHAFKTGKKKRSLVFDDNANRLYVGSQGEFGFFEQDWNYVSLVTNIPDSSQDFDEVWDVFLLNSYVYFCTFQRIYVYDGEHISVIEHPDGLDRSFVANGKLFTQSQQGQLLELKGEKLVPSHPQNHSNQIITGVIPRNDGYLLFYNSGEIEFSNSFGVTAMYPDLMQALKGTYVNHVLQLSDARLAISTQTAGLFLYDLQNQNLENITIQDGLQSNACLRSFQDYAGNLWIGMQNGIALIDINSPMRLINQEIGLQGAGYEAFEVEDGTYYTTSNGIYFLKKGASQCTFLEGTEGPSYGMQKITGKLYAGHHTGLFLLEGDRATRMANTDGLWQIKQLRSNPEYAIGGTYLGLYLFKVNEKLELQPVQKIEGFDESSRFFEEDHRGRIWVGQFYKGLYQLDLSEELTKAKAQIASTLYKVPINEQIILSRIDNVLYFACSEGLFKLDQATEQIIEADMFAEEIGDQPIYLLVQDNQKNIHIYAEDIVGFFKQISTNNYAFVRSSLFQLRYSFNNDLLNVSVNTNNGVWFNANEGFIYYNPDLENRVGIESPLLIGSVMSVAVDSILFERAPFGERVKNIDKLVVSQREKVIQFDVEAFQFNQLNNLQLRYFLKGFDDDYGEWTTSTIKEYTNLKEGDYEFRVQSQSYLGQIITSDPLYLKVQPPFYRSFGAKVFYILLGIALLVFVSRLQKRRYKHKARVIEKAKQQELAKKQRELQYIEQQKEQELSRLEEAKIKSELQHTNNLLAASTMNLVVKNEFIETIKEKLKEVNRMGNNRDTKQALEQIVKEIDITLRLQEDWEQFEHHFDQVHGDFLPRLREEFPDLTPNEQKLSVFLRLNLNTKEVANLMGISQRGVEVARYRLRKKLGLNKGENLAKFILEY